MFYLKEKCILFCRSMQQLLDYPEDDVEETFCLNFTVRWKDLEYLIIHHPCLKVFVFFILTSGILNPFANIY